MHDRSSGRNVLFLLLALIGAAAGQTLNFQLDIITHTNSAAQLLLRDGRIHAATSGGLMTWSPGDGTMAVLTSGEGLFDHRLTALDITDRGIMVTGSLGGTLGFIDMASGAIRNDVNLAGSPIVAISAVADTVWALSRDFVSVFVYSADLGRFQFRESYQEFGAAVDAFTDIQLFNGRVYLACELGLVSASSDFIRTNLYAGSNWTVTEVVGGQVLGQLRDLAVAADGNALLFSGSNGVFSMAGMTVTRLSTVTAKKLRPTPEGLLLLDDNNVLRLAGGTVTTLHDLRYATVNDLIVDGNGAIWVALERRGLRNLNSGERVVGDGPLDNYVGEMAMDSRGRLWVASELRKEERQRGLYMLGESGWVNYYFSQGDRNRYFNFNSTEAVFEDAGGNIWIGSWGGGMMIFGADGTITPVNPMADPGIAWVFSTTRDDTIAIQTPPELRTVLSAVSATEVYSLVTDIFFSPDRQSIWLLNSAATNNRALLQYNADVWDQRAYQPASWQSFANPEGDREWFEGTVDPFGDFWLVAGTARGGIVQARQQGDIFATERYSETDNLKSNSARAVAADADGYVWVGTVSGLSAILNGTVFDFRENFQPIGLRINDIFVDGNGNKWFATDKGVSILRASGSPFEPASWVDLIAENSSVDPETRALRSNLFVAPLPSEVINAIYVDARTNDVYIGTEAGLAVLRSNPFVSTLEDYSRLVVGPNPFVIADGSGARLNFINLVPGSEIKVVSINGQLIRTLNSTDFSEVKGGQAQWDGRNEEGELVATGIYLFLTTNEDGQERAGKVMVVRR